MNIAQHTPGPWTYFPKSKYDEHHVSIPIDGTNMRLALFQKGCPSDHPEADARLIAAAPELLVALQVLLTAVETVDAVADWGPELAPSIYQAARAVTKAVGGAT